MFDKVAPQLQSLSAVGVLPTDTLYGLVGSALNKKTVGRIYKLRKRDSRKPFIILISSIKDLGLFGVKPDEPTKKILKALWPGKVSVVLPCRTSTFKYLHRGTKTLAFRLPALKSLSDLLKKTGPLVAPSANREGKPASITIEEAQGYFGNNADFYVNSGKKQSAPSTIVAVSGNNVEVLRQGSVKIPLKLRLQK